MTTPEEEHMHVLTPETVDEIVVMKVPDIIDQLPADLREEAAWWYLIRGIQVQQAVPMGPPSDIEWLFTKDIGEVQAVKLRHDCPDCVDGLNRAVKALEEGSVPSVCIAQFSQTYLRDIRAVGGPFAATGVHAREEQTDEQQPG